MMKKTFTVPARKALKPRNPLVAAIRFRSAGSHMQSGASARQQAAQMLRRELIREQPDISP